MTIEERQVSGSAGNIYFHWDSFMSFLLSTPGKRECIGPAWFLFFDIANHADRAGMYTSTYSKLARKYRVALATVKAWRQHLRDSGVIESYSRGHSVAFRLLDPFASFLKVSHPSDITQSELEEMRHLLTLKSLLSQSDKNKITAQ